MLLFLAVLSVTFTLVDKLLSEDHRSAYHPRGKMSMAAYQNDHGSYLLSVPNRGASGGAASPRTHSAHMVDVLPSGPTQPLQNVTCATVLLPVSASASPGLSPGLNGVTMMEAGSATSRLFGEVLCAPQSSSNTQLVTNTLQPHNYRASMPRAYSMPQMCQAFRPNEMCSGQLLEPLNRNSALSLNVPLREEDQQLPLQANNGHNQFIRDAPPSTSTANSQSARPEDDFEPDGEIDIQIRNVVCTYTLPLHIDLHRVALNCGNVTFDRGRGVLLKQKRNPLCYVKVYSSGKIYIVGCRSETECKRAARGVARMVQKSMGKQADIVRIRNYRVCNVLATCKMPFGVKIEEMAEKFPEADYEPELSVGLVWKSTNPKATLRIHTTGSVTVTGAQSEADVMSAIEVIYPILREFRCALRLRDDGHGVVKRLQSRKRYAPRNDGINLLSARLPKRQHYVQVLCTDSTRRGIPSSMSEQLNVVDENFTVLWTNV
ncbi:TATA box-binding protein-like protein 1 [Toxocara canis]|uniref:TATA box-binding protein-like 1 n=1 Tax=Toxocara canis TaxID=6265 RepID=A0A0B2VC50_TOXCA|nr:TATA box-binding protein-like protein 1 [Toxocara canis]